jgi:uracil-DNA glycosylase family 4
VRDGERQAALEQIADEVRACTRCRLHGQRTRSVPGEGNPNTEVVFVGEGPGFNEDREGRPFVGRAGTLLVKLLGSVGWRREDVFITNVVKCRPPENRDPEADEIAACAPFLRRQLEALDPALVVTLGRYSMATFMPDARISQVHGTMRPVDPATGAADALAFAMYHPAAALRATEIEQASFRDMAGVPAALLKAREARQRHADERRSALSGRDRAASAASALAEGPIPAAAAPPLEDIPLAAPAAPAAPAMLAAPAPPAMPAAPAASAARRTPLPPAAPVVRSTAGAAPSIADDLAVPGAATRSGGTPAALLEDHPTAQTPSLRPPAPGAAPEPDPADQLTLF